MWTVLSKVKGKVRGDGSKTMARPKCWLRLDMVEFPQYTNGTTAFVVCAYST